jgi:hypothetical protein
MCRTRVQLRGRRVGVEYRTVGEVVGLLVTDNAHRCGEVEHGDRSGVGVGRCVDDGLNEQLLVEDGPVIKVGESGVVDGINTEVVGVGVEDEFLVDLNAARLPVEDGCPARGVPRRARQAPSRCTAPSSSGRGARPSHLHPWRGTDFRERLEEKQGRVGWGKFSPRIELLWYQIVSTR